MRDPDRVNAVVAEWVLKAEKDWRLPAHGDYSRGVRLGTTRTTPRLRRSVSQVGSSLST